MAGVSESNIRVEFEDHLDEIIVDYMPCDDDRVVMTENERRRNPTRTNNAAPARAVARTPRVPIVAPPSPPPRVRIFDHSINCYYFCANYIFIYI